MRNFNSAVTNNGYVAILYKTAIVQQMRNKALVFNHGGWKTLSTAKAMNLALKELNLSHVYTVKKKDHELYIIDNRFKNPALIGDLGLEVHE